MTARLFRAAAVLLAVVLIAEASRAADFEKDVARVVVRHCLNCHNPSEKKGGLDLSTAAGLTAGGDSGPVVVPAKAAESELIDRVASGSMPPGKAAKLSQAEVAALTAWVADGAKWPKERTLSAFEFSTDQRAGLDWWSLQPIQRPAVSEMSGARGRTPVDAFVLAKLRAKGLSPAPEADRPTLLRRATFDLTGLPPTPAEIEAFVNDASPDAYEKVIERLLASPAYGERWGRHWLDVVRFGESEGFERDKLRPHAWPYRDWVIRAFNDDLPFPRFAGEQLAGDVLPDAGRAGIAASGYLVAGPFDPIQFVAKSPVERLRAREDQMEELLASVGQTFLGLTVNCARCHDHKFDPIPQTDYYRLKAIFDGIEHGDRPFLTQAEEKAWKQSVSPLEQKAAKLREALKSLDSMPGEDSPETVRPAALVAGKFGTALDARRAKTVVAANPAFHKPPITVECWAKLESSRSFNILIASSPKSSAQHWELYTYVGTGDLSVYMPGYRPAEVRSEVRVTDGQWHHLAFTFDGGRVCLFVDGRKVKDQPVTRQRDGGEIGRASVGGLLDQPIGCDGLIDEVRISSVVRPLDRVPSGPFPTDAQTLALWHFDRPGTSQQIPADERARLEAELKATEADLRAKAVPMVYSGTRSQPGPTVLYLRGDTTKPGPKVMPGTLSPLRGMSGELGLKPDASEGERRRAFAAWVADPANPLPARVMANRVWLYHFGAGLVETPSDFGFNGGLPSHPELLDWLAAEFRSGGWSLKHLHRLIMHSATYRQSGRFDPKAAAADADNRLLWRFAPRRLEAEAVRDSLLAISGKLAFRPGGPSFQPFTVTQFNSYFYHLFDRDEPEFHRRTVYRFAVNTGRSPLLDAFDCPAPSVSAPKRRTTTTPLQALALMNDPFVKRLADAFSARIAAQTSRREEQVRFAYRLALGRDPSTAELTVTTPVVEQHGLATLCWALVNASEFLYLR